MYDYYWLGSYPSHGCLSRLDALLKVNYQVKT